MNFNNNITPLSVLIKKITYLALPMMGTQLLNVASGFLCMVMVAKLGHQVLAASALIFATQITVMVICMSFLFSLSIFVSHANGARNYSLIGDYVQQGWTLGIIISTPMILIFWHIAPILIFLGQSPAIVQIVQTFFHGLVWGVVPVLFLTCNQQLCYGIHKQRLVLATSGMSVMILLLSAYVLIFGKFGFPRLGVEGFGFAIATQCWFSFIFTTCYFYFGKDFKRYNLFHYRVHKNWHHLVQIFKVSWPISLQIGGEMLSFFAASTMVGWLGVRSLAAYQVVGQYLFLIVVPLFAVSQASSILIGQACGSKQFHEIKRIGMVCIGVALMLTVIVAVVFISAPKFLASLYLDVHKISNAETVHWIVLLFMVVAFSQIFDAVRNVTTGALRGLFDTRFPMWAGLFVIWIIGIPLAYCFGFILHWGVVGISAGSAIGMLVGAVAVFIRWHIMSRKICQT